MLAVVAVALANGLTAWLFADALLDQATMHRLLRASAAGTPLDPAEVPRLLAGPLGVAAVTLVAGWFLAANAIAGLRGREVTLRWVVAAGLRSLVANLLVDSRSCSLGDRCCPDDRGARAARAARLAARRLVYLLIRLQFWTLAIFDGVDGRRRPRRSPGGSPGGAVLRVFGWSLAVRSGSASSSRCSAWP